MTDTVYRAATDMPRLRHAARALAAIVQRSGGAAQIRQQTRAALTRVQALRRLKPGPALVTLPPAVRQSATEHGRQERMGGYHTGVPAGLGTAGATRFATLPRLAKNDRPVSSPRLSAATTADRLVRAAAGAIGRGGTLSAETRAVAVYSSAAARRLPRRPSSGGVKGVYSPAIGAGPRLSIAIGRRLASRIAGSGEHSRRIVAITTPSMTLKSWRHFSAATPHPPVAPGFHRTVRQPQSKSAPGAVYLDKALVGYHLAAAITTEQTRAAARPNTSAAGFNSGMAVMRPSGAGI